MATSVRIIGPTAHGKDLENQRLRRDLAAANAVNEVLRAALAGAGVDVDAILAAAGTQMPPQPARPAQAARQQIPARRASLDEAPLPSQGARAAYQPTQRVVAGPSQRQPPGAPAAPAGAGAVIRNPDGSTVQLMPNVTRGAQPARVPAPPATPQVMAAPVAAQDPARQAPRTELVAQPPPQTDDAAERFNLLEMD